MNREQKAIVIDSLKDNFSKSNASFVVKYKGLTVVQLQQLRKELRTSKGSFKVAKGRLIKRAVGGVQGLDELAPYFKDQIGVVFVNTEAPAVAKVLYDFSKQNESLKLIAGFFDKQVVTGAAIERIATLPSREVLLAQLCGTLKAPINNVVNVLNIQLVRMLWVLKKVAEKKQS